jgi:hypothetical protein
MELSLDFGIDIMEDCEYTLDTLAKSLERQHPENMHVADSTRDIQNYYMYKLERLQPRYENARIQEYLHAQKDDNDHTIPVKLLKWYTTSKLYLQALQKETTRLLDEKIKTIRERQKNILIIINQKKQNTLENNHKHITETNSEENVIKSIQTMPSDIINHIAQYVFTKPIKLAIYKKTDTEIKDLVNATKLQLLHPFLKIIKSRASSILRELDRKQTNTSPFKPSDYSIILRNITGTTKSQIAHVLLKTIQCYEYLLSITNNYAGHQLLYNAIENELLYVYKTISYIARPEMNKRTKPTRSG